METVSISELKCACIWIDCTCEIAAEMRSIYSLKSLLKCFSTKLFFTISFSLFRINKMDGCMSAIFNCTSITFAFLTISFHFILFTQNEIIGKTKIHILQECEERKKKQTPKSAHPTKCRTSAWRKIVERVDLFFFLHWQLKIGQ